MLKLFLLTVVLVWCMVAIVQAGEPKTVEECEKNIPASLKDRICELRQYTPDTSPDMDKHMQCVLRVVGFVDRNGEVEFQELLGLLTIAEPRGKHAENIKKCAAESAKVDASKKANTFYTCFLTTDSVEAFKMSVDFVELIRAGKLNPSSPFNAGQIKTLIKEIDDGLCK
ncbi:37 kDa salivary gland allergen Aed a 2-like isoform X2 [Anopheles albimanus]|uniref:37 kDa salivary gland allergen Aed a 2-like isoform X2 n=1 Tax=Anopheles albimanus TaxID=7167 RepID=UPI001640D646|nr:37 kDa salivary gland allergen Aed a 2-like isoform X2 [Anopheles albimanus]